MVEMRLRSIKINDTGDRQYVNLAEVGGNRRLPIVIGYQEAQAIDRFVKEKTFQRPLTHDLLVAMVEATGSKVERVDITELRDGTYYAMIRLARLDGSASEIDARPSDAIALATAAKAPIFVAEAVLEESAEIEA
ncbi:MAG: bifunctional nuclease family protein [Planctomycetota bacterium]